MATKVSTTDYRSRMRYWHDVARGGEDLVITDHERAVVRVSAASGPRDSLDRLEREGLLRRGTPRPRSGEITNVPAPGDSTREISSSRER